jgi:enhancing lycopene biosynthesis protein 2
VVTGEKLVLAARVQNGENHQVRIREQPLFCARAGGFGRARELSEMLVLGQSPKMVQANACKARDFVFGE